jgi:FtsP/CotA-like multicopper oxidase with cupredoxin domain
MMSSPVFRHRDDHIELAQDSDDERVIHRKVTLSPLHPFQVRTQENRGPRKDTVIVLPGRSLEVDFDADNPGQWLTHCHNIYHGESGMMTMMSYVE